MSKTEPLTIDTIDWERVAAFDKRKRETGWVSNEELLYVLDVSRTVLWEIDRLTGADHDGDETYRVLVSPPVEKVVLESVRQMHEDDDSDELASVLDTLRALADEWAPDGYAARSDNPGDAALVAAGKSIRQALEVKA